jgi:hypothetical protein
VLLLLLDYEAGYAASYIHLVANPSDVKLYIDHLDFHLQKSSTIMGARTYFAELLTKEISTLKDANAEAPLLIELLRMEMTLLHIKRPTPSVPFCHMLVAATQDLLHRSLLVLCCSVL